MVNSRIELVSSGDIVLYDNVPVPLNFAIADIRQPDKRDSSYSKTVKIPATKENNKLFKHIFDVNISECLFNPNIKAECILWVNGSPQMNGFLRLMNINVTDKDNIYYECTIKGNVGNMFQELGDQEIKNLDLSSFNHTYNRTTQKASWTNTYVNGYCYPLIDYGFDNNINHYKVEHLFPAVFVRTIIDKIFSSIGYTYESSFFDSQRFKNLVIPGTNILKLTDAQVAARLFEANLTTSGTINSGTSTFHLLPFDVESNDPANAYNTTAYRWTPPTNGYYNIAINIGLDFNTSGLPVTGNYVQAPVLAIRKTTGGIPSIIGSVTINTSLLTTANTTVCHVAIGNVYLTTADYLEPVLQNNSTFNNSGTLYPVPVRYYASGSQFFNTVNNTGLQAGDTVNMNNLLPDKIKCKDFLLDIIRMFNLYVEVDKDDSKRYLIETRNDFYSSGDIVDWTTKLDYSKDIVYEPMGAMEHKVYSYSYKDDKDYYNKIYKENYKEDYGNRNIEVVNDFVTGKKDTKIMFSPTPLAAPIGDDRVIPKIWEVDSAGVVKQKAFNIRMLYNGGVKNTILPYSYEDSTASPNVTTETQYLYAGHLDSVTSPTFDLNFAPPYEVYYQTSVYTNNNLFNIYHKKQYDELTNIDSRICTAWFHLKHSDIALLDFRNQFYFESQLWKLNKIFDYDPINPSVTKCEFIRSLDIQDFVGTEGTIYGGARSALIDPDYSPKAASQLNSKNILIQGNNNVVGGQARNGIIIGDDNFIHGSTNVTILNSSGCIVYDNLNNVTLINSSGTTVSSSNTLVINNVVITSGDIAGQYGAWSSQSYNAADYSATGGGTWTVDSGDLIYSTYKVVGKTMYWGLQVDTSTIATSPTQLQINIPGGRVVGSTMIDSCIVAYGGASHYTDAVVVATDGNAFINVQRLFGAAFTNVTNTFNVTFSITFEIE